MSTSGPDETPPPSELQGLDPKDLLQAGLETVPPVTLPPQPVDSDATIPVARPQSTQPAPQVELPLPEELTNLLPGGNYHVESFLGQGGMGAVYKGMQVRLKRPVAIKIMRRDMGKDYDFEARFEREAQAMAKLNHPNIVSVIDFGEAGADYLYIVMELIEGADLMDVIRGGQMTQEMALSLLPQVCDALQFAHDHGIVHRDIKPSNIMLTRDGRIKMADFGLAKRFDVESSFRTQTGTGMGTPDYAAPEQFDPSAPIDHRADIYALGVMIYQMITGQLPRGVWKPPSQRAAVAPQWDEIVSRAMQSDPSDRYQQASEVKTDVSSISLVESRRSRQTAEVAAPAAPQPRALASTPTKSRAPLLLGLVVGVIVIAAGAFFALKGPDESGRGRQTATEAPPDRALASTPTSTTVSIPGLPDLPPLTVPPGEPRLVKEFPVSPNIVRGLHLLPDSRRLLIVQDDILTLHDLETEKQVWFIKGGKWAVASAINEDGTRFVVGYPFDAAGKALVAPGPNGGHFEVNLHEMGTGNVMQSWKVPYKSMSTATDQIALSPSGNTLVVRTGGYGTEGTTFVALELGKSEPVAQWTPAGHHGYTTHALSETRFISTGSVPPFQMNTAAPAAKLDEPKWLAEAKYGSVFSPDRRWVVASNGSSCSVWDMATGKSHLLENSETIFSFGGFAGNDLLLRNRSNTETPKRIIQVWDRATGHLLADYPPSKPGFYWGNLSGGAPNGQFFVNVVEPPPTAPNKSDRILQVWSLPKPGQVHGLVKPPTASPAIAAPALPESGWKPLFTDAEWRVSNDDYEFAEGLLHVKRPKFLPRTQPSADGAIRARIIYREGTRNADVVARSAQADGHYVLGLGTDAKHVFLGYFKSLSAEGDILAKHLLPRPLAPGDGLLLELILKGDHLTGVVNGVSVMEAHDTHLTQPGRWGIYASPGWFESVEVQPLPVGAVSSSPSPLVSKSSATTSTPAWNDWIAEKRRPGAFTSHPQLRDEPTGLRVTADPSAEILIGTTFRNGRLRVACVPPESGREVPLILRSHTEAGNTSRYQVSVSKMTGIKIALFQLSSAGGMKWTDLKSWSVPKDFDWTREYMLEFTAMNDLLTVSLNGKGVGSVQDSKLSGAGRPGFSGLKDTRITKVEYQSLDGSTAAVSPAPNLPVAKSPSAFPPGQWVKLFTKPEDLPADLRKPDSGVKWEDGWIRLNDQLESIRLSSSVFRNAGVRARIRQSAEVQTLGSLNLRSSPAGRYSLSRDRSLPIHRVGIVAPANGVLRTLGTADSKSTSAAKDHLIEFCAIGDRLIWRLDEGVPQMARNTELMEGLLSYNGTEDLRDIEVINLDGLPEAEALRLLGVDEKGNDLRGKGGVAGSPPAANGPAGSKSPVAEQKAPGIPAGDWVSMVGKIHPVTNAVSGVWSLTAEGLFSKGGGTNGYNVLQPPYDPPEEYDFRVSFSAQSGRAEIHQIIVAAGREFVWSNAGGAGPGARFSGSGEAASELVEVPEPLAGRRHESLIEVRRDRLTGYLDGKRVVEWKPDFARLPQTTQSRLAQLGRIGVACWSNGTTFMIFPSAR